MRVLVLLSALLAAVSAGHLPVPRAYSSGSHVHGHGSHAHGYGYSLPSGHARFSSHVTSSPHAPAKAHYAPAKVHHYTPEVITKYVHKPVVKVVEVPTTIIKEVPKVVVKEVTKVIIKEVPRYVTKEVPRVIVKEVYVPKVVIKEVEVPHVVVKHVPVAHQVRVAAPAHAVYTQAVAAAPAPVLAVAAAPAPVMAPAVYGGVGAAFPYATSVSSQFHAQDELGQYDYGYSNPLSSKQEVKTADGIVRGGFSYVDANGQTVVASYYSDALGFHIARSDLPVAPVDTSVAPVHNVEAPQPVQDTPEVAAAKAAHAEAHVEAESVTIAYDAESVTTLSEE